MRNFTNNLEKTNQPALRSGNRKTGMLFLILLISISATLRAQTVSSLSALQTAINNASPGAVITLANGTYTASADITVNKQGTASQPITIQAQTIGGATIGGTGGFDIVSPAKYIIIKGFRFTHSASHASMASGTSFCRWTRNFFDTPGAGEYLQLNGNDHEIDYNTFQNKEDPGKFITVRGSGSQIAQRLWIHHNYFFNQLPQTGNGNETFQFGLSGYSLSNSNSIMEYNLFEQCTGENEMISVKASEVTIRYNTIRDCPAQFTLRHGNRCLVYGNYFINTPGIRIFGDDHKIFSNHYENCSVAINIGNGDGEVADGAPLTSHDRPDRVLIAFNTLVNNTSNIKQSGRTGGLGATSITVANNIIQGGGPAATIAGPYTDPVWSNNITFNTAGAGDMPSGGYTVVDPLLARDATGTFHLQTGSPAIGAATGSYPSVTVDMDGQSRTTPLEIGADEVSSAPVIARILTTSMVGQNGSDPTTSCLPASASADDGNVATNVLDGDLNTRWSANGDGQWIQFCLSNTVSVAGVKIAFFNGDSRTSTFDILTGTDGVNWTTAATGLVSSGATLDLETFNFNPRNAKYIRIVGHGNSVNLWNSYTEIQIIQNSCPPVIASADDGNVPANVLDNDLNTRWSASGDGQWIQFCLTNTASVTGVQIAFFDGDLRTSTFDVLVGDDGINWSTASAGRVSSGTTLNPETFNFTPVTGKYVRIVGHGNSTNPWNSFTEVRILTADQTTILTPTHDAYVRNGTNANTTFGTTDPAILITKLNPTPTAGNDRQTCLRFDLSTVTGAISSAVLQLYGKLDDNRASNIPVGAFAVSNTTWTESTITWNNKPATGASLETTTVTDSIARFYTWDITSYIQSELAAGRTQISLALINGLGTAPRITWNSKETGSNPPQLTVTTSAPLAIKAIERMASEEQALKTNLTTYPNPFRHASTITFSLQKAGYTHLAVYDITGRQVAVLVNGHLAAGNHTAQFNRENLPGGVYLVKLFQDNRTVTVKLLKE